MTTDYENQAQPIVVGSEAMQTMFKEGTARWFQPVLPGESMEEEGGVTRVSLDNMRKMLAKYGKPNAVRGYKDSILFSWPSGMSYLSTGFGTGYCGEGPRGLVTILKESGFAIATIVNISKMPQSFEDLTLMFSQ